MFDLDHIAAMIDRHGPVVRVVVSAVAGSVPREVGASMLVWADGQSGTIGGGTLEFMASEAARSQLGKGALTTVTHHPLGPALGQCCGGAVTLVNELLTQESLADLAGRASYLRPVVTKAPLPLAMKREEALARSQGHIARTQMCDGWFIEPIQPARTALWIWGAGHVGRAMVHVFSELPDFAVTWIDTAPDRFPETIPTQVEQVVAADPAQLVPYAPTHAQHLILTYSHALDLELCHQLLNRGFGFTGLIGSKTKWARFQARLRDLGHLPEQIARITCPIGDPTLGKHPQAIAIGVASGLLHDLKTNKARKDQTA